MQSPYTASHELVRAGKILAQKGFVAGSDGNLSVRLDEHKILVTPGGLPVGELSVEDVVTVAPDGQPLKGRHRPTSELAMHLMVYRSRPDAAACVHSHAPHATAFAVAGICLPEDVLPEVALLVGPVALTDYAPPGTAAVPAALEPFIGDHDAFLLRNHGLLTIGRSLDEALHRHEIVEQFARILGLARSLGNVNHIPREEVERLRALRRQAAETGSRTAEGQYAG